jgi:hypothetical protein
MLNAGSMRFHNGRRYSAAWKYRKNKRRDRVREARQEHDRAH